MCGRYFLTVSAADLQGWFEKSLPFPPAADALSCSKQSKAQSMENDLCYTPRWNICPGQSVPILLPTAQPNQCSWTWAKWGHPLLQNTHSAKKTTKTLIINARSESVQHKKTFQQAFQQHRCLIPANGFYEWKRKNSAEPAVPTGIFPANQHIIAFAGLWFPQTITPIEPQITLPIDINPAHSPIAAPMGQMVILTTAANEQMQLLHERMPVALKRSDYSTWLFPNPSSHAFSKVAELMHSRPWSEMRHQTLLPIVNNPRHDHPSCLTPALPN